MKIIREGTKHYKNAHDIAKMECQNCNTLFEFERWESVRSTLDISIYSVACPVCQKVTHFDGFLFEDPEPHALGKV